MQNLTDYTATLQIIFKKEGSQTYKKIFIALQDINFVGHAQIIFSIYKKSVLQSYTEQNAKRNTFVCADLKDLIHFLCTQKAYFSEILFTNLSKSLLVSTSPLPR